MTGQKCVTRGVLLRRAVALERPRAEMGEPHWATKSPARPQNRPARPVTSDPPQSAKRNAARPPKPGANAPAGQGASNAPCCSRRRPKGLEKWPNFNPRRQNFRRCAARRRRAAFAASAGGLVDADDSEAGARARAGTRAARGPIARRCALPGGRKRARAHVQRAKRARGARLAAVGAPLGRLMTLVEHTGAKERSGEVLDVTHDGRHDSGGVGQGIAPKINRKSLILMPQIPIFRLRRPPSPPWRKKYQSGSRSGKRAPHTSHNRTHNK